MFLGGFEEVLKRFSISCSMSFFLLVFLFKTPIKTYCLMGFAMFSYDFPISP